MGGSKNHQQISQRRRGAAALVGLSLLTILHISRHLTSSRLLLTEHSPIVPNDDAASPPSIVANGEPPCCNASGTVVRETMKRERIVRPSPPAPPVKWPQTDDRIRRAIQEGDRIGPVVTSTFLLNGTEHYHWNGRDYEAPVDRLATVVSAFYDLSSKPGKETSGRREKVEYLEWIQNFLSSTDPLVFFCERGSEWADLVRQNRQHAPTIMAYIPFRELTTSANFDESFWLSAAQNDKMHSNKKLYVKLYKIWNEKIVLAHEVSLVNPFETEHFVWVDSGYYRLGEVNWPERGPVTGPRTTHGAVNGVIVRNNMTKNGVGKDQFVVQNMLPEAKGYLIAGGAWGGTALGIQNAYDSYWKTFWFMAHHQDKPWCLGFEQHVLTHMCKSFPRLCLIQESEGGRHGMGAWHQLAEVMLRDSNYDFASSAKGFNPFNDVPIDRHRSKVKKSKMPLVPLEVSFPSNFPISMPSTKESTKAGTER